MFSQANQPIIPESEPLGLNKDAHDHPSLNLLPEIQTPPPEEIAATPTELQIPCTENTCSQDAPVLSIDTLTPPPEVDPALSAGFVKDPGKAVFLYRSLQLNCIQSDRVTGENSLLSTKVKSSYQASKCRENCGHFSTKSQEMAFPELLRRDGSEACSPCIRLSTEACGRDEPEYNVECGVKE